MGRSVFFCKKVENGGCSFVKKVENGGVFFVKKVDLSSTQGALCTVSVFFILLIWGVRRYPTHPLPMGLVFINNHVSRQITAVGRVHLSVCFHR